MLRILKRIFSYKFHVIGLFNPFINYQIKTLGEYSGVIEGNKREVPIIVSLTSYQERFSDLPKTLYSLMNQTLKPDRIILWLDEEKESLTNLPYEITRFVKHGLEIKFTKDIGPYTKIIPSLKKYPNAIIVTADDDIYYSKNWLNLLYMSYISNPEDIHVHRSHRVLLENKQILPYEKWEKHVVEETARFDNFITGVGGVLYPPKCFTSEVFREDIFLKNAPKADDIWLWVMALVHNKKIRVVKNHNNFLITTSLWKQLFKNNLYKENKTGGNDKQLNRLLKLYQQNILNKIK